MKIAFYCDYPYGSAYSIESIVRILADWFVSARKDLSVSYIANGSKDRDGALQKVNAFNTNNLEVYIRKDLFIQKKIFKKFKPIGFAMDFKLFSKYDLNLIFLDRLPSRRFLECIEEGNYLVVFLVHGIDFNGISIFPAKMTILRVLMYLQALIIKKHLRSEKVFFQVLNGHQQAYLEKKIKKENKIFQIENGLQSDEYFPLKNDNTFNIIILGRINKVPKGSNLLAPIIIKTLKRTDQRLRFYIIGTGEFLPKLRNKLSNVQKYLSNRVKLTGFVDESVKINILRSSHLIISTSYGEPFPLSILEGLYCGLKVVATPTSGLLTIISANDSFGTFVPPKSKDFVKKILEEYRVWARSPTNYDAEKENRSKFAKLMFSADKMSEEYFNMITEIIHKFKGT